VSLLPENGCGCLDILLVELRDDISIVLIEQFDQQDRIDVVARHVLSAISRDRGKHAVSAAGASVFRRPG
jgi:hypothetical protein